MHGAIISQTPYKHSIRILIKVPLRDFNSTFRYAKNRQRAKLM